MTLFAGQIVTAGELNSELEIGKVLLDVTATSDSSTWNSATRVLTNLLGTLVTRSGAQYRVQADFSLSVAGVNGYATVGLVTHTGGAVTTGTVATDTLIGSKTTRLDTVGAVYGLTVVGKFTAGSNTTYGVAAAGWNSLGAATVGLDGDATYAINRLTVTRVA